MDGVAGGDDARVLAAGGDCGVGGDDWHDKAEGEQRIQVDFRQHRQVAPAEAGSDEK